MSNAITEFFSSFSSKPTVETSELKLISNDNSSGLNIHKEHYGGKWVNFGEMNRYPNYLNDLINSSGLHASIVNYKINLTQGNGYEIISDVEDVYRQVELKQFIDKIDGENDINKFLYNITNDYWVHNTVYLKLYWNSDKTKLIKVERIDPSKIRVGYDKANPEKINRFFYCIDWSQYGQWGVKEIPAADSKSEAKIEIMRVMNINPSLIFNTLPSYAGGTNWIQLDGEVSTYHKANMENSINPGMTLKFYKKPSSPEEKRKILNDIKKNYGGSTNTGKAMVFFSDDKDSAPDVEAITPSAMDKQFSVTADAIQRNICYAHSINPTLIGLKTPGSLGGGTELEDSFNIFNKVVIQPGQEWIENLMNKILVMKKINGKFKLNDTDLNYSTKQ